MRIARPDIHRVIDTREDLEDKWNDGLAPGIILEFFLVVPEERRNIASTSKRSQYNQGAIIVEWWMLKDTCACPKPTWTSGKPLLQWRRQQADTWERWLIGNYAKIMDITVQPESWWWSWSRPRSHRCSWGRSKGWRDQSVGLSRAWGSERGKSVTVSNKKMRKGSFCVPSAP